MATINRGDQQPPLLINLTDDGLPVDLSSATNIRMIVRDGPDSGNPPIIDVTLPGRPVDGVLMYNWLPTDTSRAGKFKVQVEVTWPGALKQTFPLGGYADLEIVANLG